MLRMHLKEAQLSMILDTRQNWHGLTHSITSPMTSKINLIITPAFPSSNQVLSLPLPLLTKVKLEAPLELFMIMGTFTRHLDQIYQVRIRGIQQPGRYTGQKREG